MSTFCEGANFLQFPSRKFFSDVKMKVKVYQCDLKASFLQRKRFLKLSVQKRAISSYLKKENNRLLFAQL